MIRVIKPISLVAVLVVVCLAAACDPSDGGGGANINPEDVPLSKLVLVIAPAKGDIWKWDGTYAIRWSANAVQGKVKIHLLHKGTVVAELTSANGTKNDGLYTWTVPPELYDDDGFQIRVMSVEEPSVYGKSGNFLIRKIIYSFPTT